jgi:hypothetical protein
LDSHNIAFFLIDIVGSTHYKYIKEPEKWKEAYVDFYQQAQHLVSEEFITLNKTTDNNHLQTHYWKGLGDAVIYKSSFHSPDDFAQLSKTFFQVFNKVTSIMLTRHQLELKTCIWYATFPEINLTLATANGDDYIGPDMDLGFRLSSVTLKNRTFMAMDSVTLLAQSKLKHDYSYLHLGWSKLKGVHHEQQYPIIQISQNPSEECRYSQLFSGTRGDLGLGKVDHTTICDVIKGYKENLHYNPSTL